MGTILPRRLEFLSPGCMLVELLDYRPKRAKDPPLEKPEKSRVTLHPNDETLWADLCLMNQRTGSKLTDPQVLEVEAQILVCVVRLVLCGTNSVPLVAHFSSSLSGPRSPPHPHRQPHAQGLYTIHSSILEAENRCDHTGGRRVGESKTCQDYTIHEPKIEPLTRPQVRCL